MDRELVLAVLMCWWAGAAYLLGGAWGGWIGRAWSVGARRRARVGAAAAVGAGATASAELAAAPSSARELERRAWRQLWLPLWPGFMVLSFLLGWALQEPAGAEPLHLATFAVASPFAVLWLRVAVRAWRSARAAATATPLAGTIGLWRPRIIVDPTLRAALDDTALQAAIAHEAAHLRHRDPLRIWLAQIATDLQGSTQAARRRLATWRAALELARDDEACARGVDGGDLAAALLTAARLVHAGQGGATRRHPAVADLTSSPSTAAFHERVSRLLRRDAAPRELASRWGSSLRGAAVLAATSAALVALGHAYGETLITWLPGHGW